MITHVNYLTCDQDSNHQHRTKTDARLCGKPLEGEKVQGAHFQIGDKFVRGVPISEIGHNLGYRVVGAKIEGGHSGIPLSVPKIWVVTGVRVVPDTSLPSTEGYRLERALYTLTSNQGKQEEHSGYELSGSKWVQLKNVRRSLLATFRGAGSSRFWPQELVDEIDRWVVKIKDTAELFNPTEVQPASE